MIHPPDTRRWTALVLLCVAQAMLVLDVSVVNIALPRMGTDLGLDRTSLTWVVTVYELCFGGLMVFGGRLADTLGRRRMLLVGLTLFTAASLLCGLSANGTTLIAARAAQGVGAALLSPAALSTITTMFNGPERARALGVWAAVGAGGAAAGVLLGGVLTSGPGWAWIFFVNVPVGIAVVALVPSVIRAADPESGRKWPDVPGALVVTLATGLLIYGLTKAGDAGWSDPATLLPLGASVAAYAVFGLIERAARTPLVPPSMLRRRPVLAGSALMLVATGLLIAFFFLCSQYLQKVLGLSAIRTGLLFLPATVVITLGAYAGSHLVGRFGGRVAAVAGLVLVTAGAALLAGLPAHGSAAGDLLPGFLLAALGIGPVFVAATTTAMAHVSQHEAGLVSGVVNTFHELGGAVGVAFVSTIAAASLSTVRAATGFDHAFTACAVVAAAAIAVALFAMPAGRPPANGHHFAH